jgi:protein-tyrosine phosphatase
MIDLHCHILPGVDDGSPDLNVSLEMARMAVSDGISTIACTPHILPGVYNNNGISIEKALNHLRAALGRERIPLHLVAGADAHLTPDLLNGLTNGQVPTIAGSRYFLLEPPHHVAPPRLEAFVFNLMTIGYVPILTHPERLSWIEGHYALICRLSDAGVLMQITAGSVLGRFGSSASFWAERMLDEGLVDIIATDAHHSRRRTPRLARARDLVATRYGYELAMRAVATLPQRILQNVLLSDLRLP